MAAIIRITVSPSIKLEQKPAPAKRCTRTVARSTNHDSISLQTTPLLQIRSSIKIKVFEDESSGIVCYRDDKGEITCEGYDEGPRLHHRFPSFTCNQRDADVIEVLQRRLLQIVDGADKDESNHNTFC